MTSGAIDIVCYSVGPMPCRIGTRLLYLIFLLSFFNPIDSVCIHCKDSIVGCKGGDECPTIADVITNGALFEEASIGKVPKASGLLPPQLLQYFTRPVMEAIVAIACFLLFRWASFAYQSMTVWCTLLLVSFEAEPFVGPCYYRTSVWQ